MALSKEDLAAVVAAVTAQAQQSAAEAAVSGRSGAAVATAEWVTIGKPHAYGKTGLGQIKAAQRGDLFSVSKGRKAFYFEAGEAELVDATIKALQTLKKAMLK